MWLMFILQPTGARVRSFCAHDNSKSGGRIWTKCSGSNMGIGGSLLIVRGRYPGVSIFYTRRPSHTVWLRQSDSRKLANVVFILIISSSLTFCLLHWTTLNRDWKPRWLCMSLGLS